LGGAFIRGQATIILLFLIGEMPMSHIKEEALRVIGAMPDDCTWEQIQYHLYVREKVMRGLAAADRGEVVPHDLVKKMVSQWQGSSGQRPR
jgi:predicted transcriptional regulator